MQSASRAAPQAQAFSMTESARIVIDTQVSPFAFLNSFRGKSFGGACKCQFLRNDVFTTNDSAALLPSRSAINTAQSLP
jgi:hypothetical protein